MKKFGKIIAFSITALFIASTVPLSVYADNEAGEGEETAEETVLSESTFESFTFEDWSAFGGRSQIYLTDKKAHSGNVSLATSDREMSWSGPTIILTEFLTPDSALSFSAYVISEKAEGAAIQMTVKTVDIYGAENYVTIASADVTGSDWTLLEGEFIPADNIAEANMYIETVADTSDFCIDDIIIKGIPKPPEEEKKQEDKYSFGFEASLDGWTPRGDMTVELSDRFSYKGRRSLYAYDRKELWHAPTVRLDNLRPGVDYLCSAYVMYNGREYDESHIFQLKLQYILNGSEVYTKITNKDIQKGTWSKLTGHFTIPSGATDVFLYIQTDDVNINETNLTENDLLPFFVDEVNIENYIEVKNRGNLIKTIVIIAVSCVVFALATTIIILLIKRSRKRKNALRSACLDAMTNTFNRNIFEEKMRFFEESPDKAKKVFISVCDVNSLKYINDNYGHENGDKAIIRCAEILLRAVGKNGKVYRTGGDEFICICEKDMTEDIKKEISLDIGTYKGYPFDVAVGTACYDKEKDGSTVDIKAIFARADKEMYKNKQEMKKNNNTFTE